MKNIMLAKFALAVLLCQSAQAQVFTPSPKSKPRPKAQPQPIAPAVLARSFNVTSMVWEEGLTVRGCYIGSVYQNDENGRAKGSLRMKGPTGKVDTLGACREQSEREFDATLLPKNLPNSGPYTLRNESFPSTSPFSIEFSFSGNELEGSYSTSSTFIRRVTTRVYSITGKRTACVGFLKGICYSAMMQSQGDTWRVLYGFTQNQNGEWQARGAYWNRYDAGAGFARFRLAGNAVAASGSVPPSSGVIAAQQEGTTVARTIPLSKIGGMDSYIRSSLPSALWSKETAIIVGGWGDEYRGLVSFDVSRLPEIPEGYSAKLYLYERAPDDGSANRPTSMISYRSASPISSQTAWQNRPEVERDTESEREVTGEGWLAMDITSYIESWRAGAPNYGIILVPRSTDNKFNFFVSSDDTTRPSLKPYIRIERDVESAAVVGQLGQKSNPPLLSSVVNAGPYARFSSLDGTWRARLDPSAGSTQISLSLGPFTAARTGELHGSVTLNNGRSSCSADLKLNGVDETNALHMEMLRPASGNACGKLWGLIVRDTGNQILVEWFDQNTGKRDMDILFSKL